MGMWRTCTFDFWEYTSRHDAKFGRGEDETESEPPTAHTKNTNKPSHTHLSLLPFTITIAKRFT